MNKFRHPDYINISHKIGSCRTIERLNGLRQLVQRFQNEHPEDGEDLLTLFALKERQIKVYDWEETTPESLYHQRLSPQ